MALIHTRDHDAIRMWAEAHGAMPALRTQERLVGENTGEDGSIDFSFEGDEGVDYISWDEFFDRFEANGLIFQHADEMALGEEGVRYRFLTQNEAAQESEDETELPDDTELGRENVTNSFAGEDDPFNETDDPQEGELERYDDDGFVSS